MALAPRLTRPSIRSFPAAHSQSLRTRRAVIGAGPAHRRGACLPKEPERLVLARLLLAQGQPAHALALLDRLHAAVLSRDRTRSVIEVGRSEGAGARRRRRRRRRGGRPGWSAEHRRPQGRVRVFTDEGPPMARCWASSSKGQWSD